MIARSVSHDLRAKFILTNVPGPSMSLYIYYFCDITPSSLQFKHSADVSDSDASHCCASVPIDSCSIQVPPIRPRFEVDRPEPRLISWWWATTPICLIIPSAVSLPPPDREAKQRINRPCSLNVNFWWYFYFLSSISIHARFKSPVHHCHWQDNQLRGTRWSCC